MAISTEGSCGTSVFEATGRTAANPSTRCSTRIISSPNTARTSRSPPRLRRGRGGPRHLIRDRDAARLLGLPPRTMLRVPADGVPESFFEPDRRRPAKLRGHLRVIEEVTPIVRRPILHIGLQRSRLPQRVQHGVGDLLDAALITCADVVG